MKPTLLALALILSTGTAIAAQDVGLVEQTIAVPHHAQDMQLAVMFPAAGQQQTMFAENAVFYGTPVVKDAAPLPGRHPVVLLSHGWGGNYARMAWLSAGLVARGAIVVAVNHPASTTTDLDFDTAFHHWTRAQDLSAALDHVLQDPTYAPLIDASRIYAAGFSYGGWTALSLAGVRGNRAGFFHYCEAAGAGSQFCAELAAEGVDITAIDQGKYEASYRDPRISGVAAIDPGLTWDLAPEDVADVTVPLLLVGLGEGADRLNATDTSTTGSNFAALVPQASVRIIAPAMHFSALGLCKPAGEAILIEEHDDPVCTDPVGTNRAQVLDQIIDALADHFELN
ncbi:alpha/beta hydrolase family protein [Puniceibacterium sediminis]|uniref:Predicted dienelactone hydrolase n=1 Tax=Puniceibacterium sediminis TaxID=1608407 RepID=A0A238Y567_9RHOB|nr:hypothetical protein [Puniceibacterium sediminis]SNR66160.1 Predicted dienelactone hydrolase [Puniceibacterium sediminis]